MKLDLVISGDLPAVGLAADVTDDLRLDGLFIGENCHDPFLALTPVALRSPAFQIGTSVAVAFSRNPMSLALQAHDMHRYAHGRFVLGLGSQVKAHVTRRFSMPWSSPVERMREFVAALRAIWATWNERVPLDFRGEHYTHTLMTPMFDPGPTGFGPPPVFLAGVGPKMTELAGEVAAGLFVHSFTTAAYLRTETLAAVQRGLDLAGRNRADVSVAAPIFVVTGRDERETSAAAAAVRERLAFYGSTPAYRAVLEHHGWGDAQTELHRLAGEGAWKQMADVFDDAMLATFAVVAEPAAVGLEIVRRFGDAVDRVSCSMPYDTDRELLPLVIAGFPERSPRREQP